MTFRNTFLILVLVVVSGWVGFWLGEKRLQIAFQNWQPAVVFNKNPILSAAESGVDFQLFWTVWDKVNQMYVDKDKLVSKKMVEGAIARVGAAIRGS